MVRKMNSESSHRVGMVAKLTGLTTHTLRTWERRYGAVVPGRTDAGGRLYTSEDVQRLRLLRDLVDAGHAIGTVATLSDRDLARLSATSERSVTESETQTQSSPVEAFLDAVARLDVGAAEGVMARAAVAMAPERFLIDMVSPALREVGARWERKEFRIAHERVATGAARGLLFSLARLYPPREQQGAVVVAAPRGERHEVGALMVAMLAALRGFAVVYMGADVPENEIAYVAEVRNAELVLLSVINLSRAEVRQVARSLSAVVPAATRIIMGGAASISVEGTRVEQLPGLADLDVLLRSIAP
jgi:methanogenic corrinoid protein MtbC1